MSTITRKTVAAILYWATYFLAGDFGYSQPQRWAGLKGGKAAKSGSFDCTSIIGAILYLAGYIPLSLIQGTWWSGNLADKLEKAGWKRVSAKGKSLAWLQANVVAGAVLVGKGHGVLGLGGGWILSWEYSELGTASGKLGRQKGERVGKRKLYLRSHGWDDLLLPPADAKAISTTKAPLAMRVAWAAQQAPRFGGSKDYAARGRAIAKLGASLVGASETLITAKGERSWAMRAAICKVLGKAWKRTVARGGSVTLFWQSSKYKRNGAVRQVEFAKGDKWHGAMAVPLRRRDAGVDLDVIVAHIRPRDAFRSDQAAEIGKRLDIKRALELVGTRPAIIMGDFAKNFDTQMRAAGFVRVTPDADSYDAKGVQKLDAIYLQSRILAGLRSTLVNPGSISDHLWPATTIVEASNPTTV